MVRLGSLSLCNVFLLSLGDYQKRVNLSSSYFNCCEKRVMSIKVLSSLVLSS